MIRPGCGQEVYSQATRTRVVGASSRVNSSVAIRFCDEFRKRTVDTWLDARDLAPGVEWDQGVISAIQSAAGFVFLIGPPGPGDRWQTFEWQQVANHEYYLDRAKPLIPALIGDPDVPGFLKTRQSLVLGDTHGSCEDVADKIVSALNNPGNLRR
jgi:TIR domain